MQIGIIGLSLSGKSTLFTAMTGSHALAHPAQSGKGQFQVATIKVPDPRLEQLVQMFQPRKVTHAIIEYLDFPGPPAGTKHPLLLVPQSREVEALALVIRAFEDDGVVHPLGGIDIPRDLDYVETELILADLQLIENRLERLKKGGTKGERSLQLEADLLARCQSALLDGTSLRLLEFSGEDVKRLRGFQLYTLKPLLVIVNQGEKDMGGEVSSHYQALAATREKQPGCRVTAVCGKLEAEIGELPEKERAGYLQAMGIERPALEKVITLSYELMGLISFFTVGEDEVRAWTIPAGTPAMKAAGVIHTDLERGFIRAEVIPWEDLVRVGSMAAARDSALLRIEGKGYVVQDGEIMHVRFHL
ncbi:MAG TPA: redox-regulated ATPase YchF [bacterium]|nr:redox-regulated ATPase YchF [bacterium]